MDNCAFDIPVVLFVFRRLDTVKLIMEKLEQIKPRVLYIFSDGPREGKTEEQKKVQEVRKYIKNAVNWECDLHLEYANQNKGCAANICEGINKVFETEKSAIIFEDDAVPMIEFFEYCNVLLQKYEGDKRIQYIAGFNAIGDTNCIKESYAFSKSAPMSGAIAIWADRWNECDFSMKDWPKRKKDKSLEKYFYFKELYKQTSNAFEDSYKNINDGWDYQFQFDQLNKERFAIVPRGNLARSYGYTEGAFHKQDKRVAKNLIKIMDYTKVRFEFPLTHPDEMKVNEEYDKLRQKLYLCVNGSFVIRHIIYAKRNCKDVAYRFMPKSVWNFFRELVRRVER